MHLIANLFQGKNQILRGSFVEVVWNVYLKETSRIMNRFQLDQRLASFFGWWAGINFIRVHPFLTLFRKLDLHLFEFDVNRKKIVGVGQGNIHDSWALMGRIVYQRNVRFPSIDKPPAKVFWLLSTFLWCLLWWFGFLDGWVVFNGDWRLWRVIWFSRRELLLLHLDCGINWRLHKMIIQHSVAYALSKRLIKIDKLYRPLWWQLIASNSRTYK